MKTRRFELILGLYGLLLLSACQPKDGHASILDHCLDSESVYLLNQMVTHFESALFETYKSNDGKAYKMFVSDVAMANEPGNLMLDKEFHEMSRSYKDSPFFATMKVKASSLGHDDFLTEIPPVAGEESKVYDPFVMNPNAPYTKCIMAESELIEEISEIFNSGLDISPTLTSGVLASRLTDSDYDRPLVQLMIATHIYYEIGLVMLEVKSLQAR